ncbi:hypothetical protein [Pseudohongiella sp. O18]|uniref:hypothetical protein n=1 Tax=Pseudohongiella sp. O18 TaxID=2904248 RepID=UPI001F488A90|nr:hypothetical protein [Pseudohongiella sp. O18]
MSIIRTGRNHIADIKPLTGDVALLVRIGKMKFVFPIHQHDEAIEFCKSLTDDMAAHTDVVPIDADELLRVTGTTNTEIMASLSEADREDIRQVCIATSLDVIRNCNDPKLLRQARTMLSHMDACAAAH